MIPDALTGGPRFAAYCERYIRQTKGRWSGQPLVFEDWQREFWWEAFEFDPATGLRVYNEVGLGIPRKNSKSTMASAAGIYLLDADGEAEPEVYVAAAAKNQAGIVLGQARNMVQRSPLLLDRLKPRRYSIEAPTTGGIMRSLSSDGALQHGLNPSGNIIDELHAHKNADLYTALTTGTGAREQPFTLWITTAGVAGEGILSELYDSIFSGTGEIERRGSLLIYRDRVNGTLIYWYGAPRDADIEDPAVWFSCNPASWLRDGRYLSQQFARLKARGGLLEWRRFHLNQFVGFEETWLPENRWADANSDAPLNRELPVGVGIDKSPDSEVGAIVIAQRQGDRIVVRSEVFPPEAATGVASNAKMRARLVEIRGEYPAPMGRDDVRRPIAGPMFGYDPHAFDESATMLSDGGLNMVEMPMTPGGMASASTLSFELITTGRLLHDDDPILAEHVANTTAKFTDRGQQVTRPKVGSSRRNAAAIALVRAVGLAMQDAPPPKPTKRPSQVVSF